VAPVDPLLAVAGPILTLLGVLAAGYFTYRSSSRKLHSDSGQKMIDQMQEDVAELRREVATLQRQVRIQGDYIGVLRRHIGDGQPPPPPSWPDGLIS
jgi:cell division protein FtsB